MQEVRLLLNPAWARVFFYAASGVYYSLLLLTNAGNYFHGGTLIEMISLRVVAAGILFLAAFLFWTARGFERALIVALGTLPVCMLVWPIFNLF